MNLSTAGIVLIATMLFTLPTAMISSYVINCYGIKNCLGAVNKDHAEYEILNKKYSKEEYEILSKEILEDIRRKNLGWSDIRSTNNRLRKSSTRLI